MPFCPACGDASADDARFCRRCGRDLGAPPIPAQPPAEDQVPRAEGQAPPVPGQAPPVPGQPPSPPSPPPPYSGPSYGPPASGPPVYAPPAYAPPPYAPSPYAAVPQAPSPVALFLRRTVSGDWTGPLKAALWPTAVLLVFAAVLATQSNRQLDTAEVGYGTRLRCYLAMVLQGVGGVLGVKLWSNDSDSSYDDSDSTAAPLLSSTTQDAITLSVVPLVVTVLWALALVLALRHLRRTQTGAEAAIRVAVVCAVAALVLALFAQPDYTVSEENSGGRVEVSSGPFTVLLWAFVLSLLVGLFVLCRDRWDGPSATSPGLAAAARALRAAMLALGTGVALCAVIVLIVLSYHSDEMNSGAWTGVTILVLNGGVSALGLAWGVPVEATRSGTSYDTERFGLSDLDKFNNGWAVPGAVAAGVVCALILGLVAVRLCADRREQWLAAGFHAGLFVLLIALGGAEADYTEGSRSVTVGAASLVPEALLFGLLWSFGGVLAVTFFLRVREGGQGGWGGYPPGHAPAYPPGYGQPGYGQPGHGQPGPQPQDQPSEDPRTHHLQPYEERPHGAPPAGGFGEPELLLDLNAPPGKPARAPRNRLLVIGLIMLGAFAIGGAAAAGVMLYNRDDDKPAEPGSSTSSPAVPGDEASPSDSASPSDDGSPSDGSSPSDDASPTDSTADTPFGSPTDDPTGGASDNPAGLPSGSV
ncbi:zinc ribbon domain-containing protein [Streptomyces sp. H39-S7]|uniref:zinc ribbon domain-containing protein n=1 Tax=Streptomyces sp. H39-S7 TaxID=3004357 RepID=UPI0022B000EB|nr:zinc ribbon domain-containing protein [Streptomyces sp. H39-S7]MCZ4122216.1 zinc ribbon domain-containing protein [Streptomyces sp. H39-S7]